MTAFLLLILVACGPPDRGDQNDAPAPQVTTREVTTPDTTDAGRGFVYFNVEPHPSMSLQTGEDSWGYLGEIMNRSGQNWAIIGFHLTVYDGNQMIGLVPFRFTDFRNGEIKSFLTQPVIETDFPADPKFAEEVGRRFSYTIRYDSGHEEDDE